jgi:uncharacterized protein YcbK (DUF882 family)
MMAVTTKAENKLREELKELDKSVGGLHTEIQNAHRKAAIEQEFNQLNKTKQDIIKYVTILREKRENTIISIDKIMFDNTVMFDQMIKNFTKLKNYC